MNQDPPDSPALPELKDQREHPIRPGPNRHPWALERHQRLVDRLARSFARRLGGSLVIGDLRSAGYLCLADSVERFDPDRGVPLGGYLHLRIKGAIIDALRTQDPLTRELREFARALAHARWTLGQRLLRPPESDELATELGYDLERFHTMRTRVALRRPRRLRAALSAADLLLEGAPGPLEALLAHEARFLLAEAVDRLEPRLRMLICRVYLDGTSQRELAAILGVTEGRVSQLHARALLLLRQSLIEREAAPAPR